MATQTESQKQQVRQLREERIKNEEALKNKRNPLGFEKFAQAAPTIEAPTTPTPRRTETTLTGEIVNVGEGDEVIQRKGGIRELRRADGTTIQLEFAPKDIEPETPSIVETQEDIEKQRERLITDIGAVEEQITLSREQIEREREEAQEIQEATTGALTASLAESRLGATTSAAGQAAEAGVRAIERQAATFSNQLQQNAITLQQKERELERAVEDFDEEAADQLVAEIAAIQEENQAIQSQLEDTQTEQQAQLFNVIDSLGSSVGLLPPEQVGAQFSAVGLPSSFGEAFAIRQSQVLQAEQDLQRADTEANRVKLQQAQANLVRTQQEIQSFGQQKATTAQQNFGFFQQLQQTDPQAADQFARLTGISPSEKELAEVDRIRAQTLEIAGEVSPTTGGKNINIEAVSIGEALPLNSLGNSGQVLRTDRHNNPIADKAYNVLIERLKEGGLVEGVDFGVGETTQGIDTDGVATIMYKDATTGVKGSIISLEGGTIGSWYANPSYGGSTKVLQRMRELTGKPVTNLNAQQTFNNMTAQQQTDIVKTIYSHEGGTQMFKTSPETKQLKNEVTSLLIGIGGTAEERENLKTLIFEQIDGGNINNIQDVKSKFGVKSTTDKELQSNVNSAITDVRKNFNEINDAAIRALAISEGGNSGVADLGLVVSFLKNIDPGSVARESEVDAVANARGVLDGFEALTKKFTTGEKLTDKQRQQIVDAITQIKEAVAAKALEDFLLANKEIEDRGLTSTIPQFELRKIEEAATPKNVFAVRRDLDIFDIEEAQPEDFEIMSNEDFLNSGAAALTNEEFYNQ